MLVHGVRRGLRQGGGPYESGGGKGVGRLVNEAAIAHAFEHGAITVDLTSRPSREAANRLYQRIGFVARDTNVYRFAKPAQLES